MTYATLYHTAYSVKETVGQVTVPVLLNNPTGSEVQMSVSVVGGNAVEGEDYEIVSPASGVLTFSGDTDSLAVVVDIISHEGEFTGGKDLSIQLSSLTSGVTVNNFNTCKISITDLDHPLSAFVGEWEGTLMFATNPPTPLSTVLNITIDAEDETYTKMIIDGWEAHPSYKGYAVPVTAVYDPAKSPNVHVLVGQVAWNVQGYGFTFFGYDGSSAVDLELAYDAEARTLTQLNMYGCYNTIGADEDLGWWSLYNAGTVFTKK